MPDCCVTCGRALPKPKTAAIPATVDTSTMSDTELFAHYKRTAIAEDLRFILRTDMSAELRTRAESIAKPTAKDLQVIRAAWRREREDLDRAFGYWHKADKPENASPDPFGVHTVYYGPDPVQTVYCD
jgi:hypothetical protein